MISLGLITTLTSIFIIVLWAIMTHRHVRLFSVGIFMSVLITVGVFCFTMATTASREGVGIIDYTEYAITQTIDHECSQSYKAIPRDARWVVLRLDDVQGGAWRDVSFQIIEDAEDRDMNMLLGVIPYGLSKDKKVINFLRKRKCFMEIGLHGWDNLMSELPQEGERAEFEDLSQENARDLLTKGKSVIHDEFDMAVHTFIPPNNAYSTGTRLALYDLDIPAVSSIGSWFFDYDATTYDFDKNRLVSPEIVLDNCEISWNKDNICVIMIHPQDFTSFDGVFDRRVYDEYYVALLDRLATMDRVAFTTPRLYEQLFGSVYDRK